MFWSWDNHTYQWTVIITCPDQSVFALGFGNVQKYLEMKYNTSHHLYGGGVVELAAEGDLALVEVVGLTHL